MRYLLGFDPGNLESHAVLFDCEAHRRNRDRGGTPVERTIIQSWSLENNLMLDLLPRIPADLLIMEKPAAFPKRTTPQSILDTCIETGRFLQAWKPRKSVQMLRREITGILLPRGSGKNVQGTKDSVIRAELIQRLGEPGTKKQLGPTGDVVKDQWQALAAAVAYWDRYLDGGRQFGVVEVGELMLK